MNSRTYDSAFRIPHSAFRIQKFGRSLLSLLSSVILLLFLTSCGGGKGSSTPSNVGGGYTLQVSGGTLNDGTTSKGLVVLATLRNSGGMGPGAAAGWTITITGPGIGSPLTVNYDDGSSSSYITWWWERFNPQPGNYTAKATNGATTLTYNFSVDTSFISQPDLQYVGNTVSWNPVAGAGSYYYQVIDSSGTPVSPYFGYLDGGSVSYSFSLDSTLLPSGGYQIEVFAHTKSRVDLMNDPAASPYLPSPENVSVSRLDFVAGSSGSGYTLDARGGVLYEDEYPVGTHHYGLVIWTSLLTNTTSPTPPAGDWTMTVTGPGISTPIVFIYPGTYSHYIWWDFGAVPGAGTSYTVTAVSSGGTSISQPFTIPNVTSKLPVATGLTATATNGGGATVIWSAVTGANSYYVNVWTDVGGVYTEIAGSWVASISAVIPNGTLTKGVSYDVYVTACQLDMTDMKSVPLPVTPGTQVDMSDTYYTYYTFTAL